MNRGLQRGLGLATLRGADANYPLPRPMPTLPHDNAASWRPTNATLASNLALVQNTLYAYRYYLEPGCTIVGISAVCTGVASTTIRFGFYEDRQGAPSTLIYDTQEEISSATTGNKPSACSVAEDGWIWLAAAIHGGAGQAYSVQAGSDRSDLGNAAPAALTGLAGYSQAGITGPLPNPWGTTLTEASRVPIFFVDVRPF